MNHGPLRYTYAVTSLLSIRSFFSCMCHVLNTLVFDRFPLPQKLAPIVHDIA